MTSSIGGDAHAYRPGSAASTTFSAADSPSTEFTWSKARPVTGKTTLSLQFLLEGMRAGETGLYITLSETAEELSAVAETHGWSLGGLSLFELLNQGDLDPDREQTILHPSEVELGETSA